MRLNQFVRHRCCHRQGNVDIAREVLSVEHIRKPHPFSSTRRASFMKPHGKAYPCVHNSTILNFVVAVKATNNQVGGATHKILLRGIIGVYDDQILQLGIQMKVASSLSVPKCSFVLSSPTTL